MDKALDTLRGWYASAPPSTRALLGRAVGLLPASMKYGRTFTDTQADMQRARHDTAFVEEQRLALLRQTIVHASRAPYYQELFKKIFGTIPDSATFTFNDLARLPVLTKDDIRDNPEAFLTKPLSEVDTVSTSGSSGRPLTFYVDKSRGAKEFATITSFWSQIGFDYRSSKRAVLRGVQLHDVDQSPWEYDAALRELRLSPFHMNAENMAEFLKRMDEYHVDYIHGYPSSIVVLADYIISEGARVPDSLKGILPVSESTLPHQWRRMVKAFPDCRIMKYYGMSEKTLIAGQVGDNPDLYDFEPLYGYAELLDASDKPITRSGQAGRIIGTGFISSAMPLLRYDTEDIASFVHAASAQNRYRFRVSDIRGRWGEEYVLGRDNELVSMSAINIHSDEYSKIHAFQLYQEVAGEVVARVIAKQGIKADDLEPFCKELQEKVGNVLTFSLELVDDLPFSTKNGKRKFIDQTIDLTLFIERA